MYKANYKNDWASQVLHLSPYCTLTSIDKVSVPSTSETVALRPKIKILVLRVAVR